MSVNGQDERRINAPPLIVPPVFANGQSRRESPKMASRPFQFLRECIYKFGVGRGTGFSYTPCLLMKPDLRLRLHATQAQPCFLAASNLAASNALALPGGNGIFTATPTKRITHYTLLRKVVCQMGALPPLETPTRKGGTLPLHGAHTAFSCYPALRLYRLSKSQRGIDVVSLSK